MITHTAPELGLAEKIGEFRYDPLGFVMFAFPWGQKGILEHHDGPDIWQQKFLDDLGKHVSDRNFDGKHPVMPVRMAVSSGHGIGKGVIAAMIFWWIMSTRPYAQGTVTANSYTQLETKTWAKIRSWGRMCITGDWFQIGSERVVHKEAPESWFASLQSCKEENSENFAGQHAENSTSFYIFDEASAIPEKIYEVASGGITEGEPMWFQFGNPTRNSGAFYRCCFGSSKHLWDVRCIDSRECKYSNKAYIQEVLEESEPFGGENSDRVRVRVRGLPPAASSEQYIDNISVWEAQKREVKPLGDEPLVLGIDFAAGGADTNVFRYRRGLDARSIPPVIIPGERARDSMWMVTRIAQELDSRRPDFCFIDATGGSVGGPMGDRLRQLGYSNVIDVGFSAQSPDPKCANMRAYMWKQVRDWLPKGAIDKSPQLETDLTGPGFHADRLDRLVIESKESMKKRGSRSPDDGDALALTFAQPVRVRNKFRESSRRMVPATAWS